LAKKVIIVDNRTSLLFWFFNSSETCIHNASDKASAIAIVRIHHITIILDSLPKANHIISHNVVITLI